MSKKTLTQIFNIKRVKGKLGNTLDSEEYPNKTLLDELRISLINDIMEKDIRTDNLNDFIKEEIDEHTKDLDITNLERNYLYTLIDNEINGFGPLTEVLDDDNITEILINGPKEVYIELNNELIKDETINFINNEHILRTIRRVLAPIGLRLDKDNPLVDGRLLDGSRINAITSPISPKGPIVTIKKYNTKLKTMDDLIRVGTLTKDMANFLELAIKAKLNIVISGTPFSGRTTLLNILAKEIPSEERVITIEDAPELTLEGNNIISLETSKNLDDERVIETARHMHSDRIILGKVSTESANIALETMTSGIPSLISLHASSINDAVDTLEKLVLTRSVNTRDICLEEILDGVDLILQIKKLPDGKRKITNIAEPSEIKDNKLELKNIFNFNNIKVTEKGELTGVYNFNKERRPRALDKIKGRGYPEIEDMFKK